MEREQNLGFKMNVNQILIMFCLVIVSNSAPLFADCSSFWVRNETTIGDKVYCHEELTNGPYSVEFNAKTYSGFDNYHKLYDPTDPNNTVQGPGNVVFEHYYFLNDHKNDQQAAKRDDFFSYITITKDSNFVASNSATKGKVTVNGDLYYLNDSGDIFATIKVSDASFILDISSPDNDLSTSAEGTMKLNYPLELTVDGQQFYSTLIVNHTVEKPADTNINTADGELLNISRQKIGYLRFSGDTFQILDLNKQPIQ